MPFMQIGPYKESTVVHRSVELLLLGFPLLFILFCIVLRLMSRDLYVQFVIEDGPVELATGMIYALAMLVAVMVALNFWRAKRRYYALLYALLALGFLFICGEEISWGQRYIGFQSPEFFSQHNLQEEVTLHNLVHGQIIHVIYATVAFYGVFARFLVPQWIRHSLKSDLDYFIPGRGLLTFFLVPLVYFSIPLSIIWKRPLHGYLTYREQEPTEFLLSLGFFCFVTLALYRQSKKLSFDN